MPLKSGKNTPQERVFVEHYASTGNATYAATKAKYAHPEKAAAKLMARPAVAAAAHQASLDRLSELIPASVARVAHIIESKSSKDTDALRAVGMLWEATGFGKSADTASKDMAEMTPEEMQAEMAELRSAFIRRVDELSGQARDVTPTEPDQGAFG